jgi:hypothetical protein
VCVISFRNRRHGNKHFLVFTWVTAVLSKFLHLKDKNIHFPLFQLDGGIFFFVIPFYLQSEEMNKKNGWIKIGDKWFTVEFQRAVSL